MERQNLKSQLKNFKEITMFKNVIAYRFNKPFTADAAALESAMAGFKFTPCGSQDASKYGFTNALGKHGHTLAHSAEGYHMVAVTKEVKMLPSSVVKEALDAKVELLEHAEGRKLAKKEKDALKDEVIQEMLPRAFTRQSVTRALIMPESQLILVDSSSYSKAEELLALLRKALGSLPVIPLSYKTPVESTLTEWLKSGAAPLPFEMQNEAELRCNETGIARFKDQDLSEDEVLAHVATGKQVHKLALNYGNSMSFIACSDGSLKRIKFADEFMALNDELDDAAARLDADFILCAREIGNLMCDLWIGFGGYESLECK
jgi:recombination associated protein RdgC